MAEINLSGEIQGRLPSELVGFLRLAGEVAAREGVSLYLVGGVVRDLLLGRTNLDLDLVVEGDAITLARQLAELKHGKIVTHSRFNTAKIKWESWSVDLAAARSEVYVKPGALPDVSPSSIYSDLSRRDFTINTMAVCLQPDRYGELIDLYDGRKDLKRRLIRILHEKSFIDDATRIWRAIRYEQRLGFSIEPVTLRLLKRDIAYLDTISGDRIRHEMELVLMEEQPEEILRRADELGVLARVHSSLKCDLWLAKKIRKARGLDSPYVLPEELYLALLTYRLSGAELEQLISYLRLPKAQAEALRDTISLKAQLPLLADAGLAPGRIYRLLHSYPLLVIIANRIASDSAAANKNMELFLLKLRHMKPILSGNDLIKMGIASGPRIKELLELLLEARLDGKVTSRRDEEEWVKQIKRSTPPS